MNDLEEGPEPPSAAPGPAHVTEDEWGVLRRKNRLLANALRAARQELAGLHAEVRSLTTTPHSFGTVVAASPTRRTLDVLVGGRKMRCTVREGLPVASLWPGQEVLLNDHLVVVEAAHPDEVGDLVGVTERLPRNRVSVRVRDEEERVLRLSEHLVGEGRVRAGDTVRADLRGGFALELVDRADSRDLMLEEIPDVSYADIGGLGSQITAIRDAIELPLLHPELFRAHRLAPPKGVLLYGPPGCGKTLIAKAVATSLAGAAAQMNPAAAAGSYFLSVKGPELLTKYVGETERHIREIFARARVRASTGLPVVVFFDEMDSLFRTRGSGRSSDVETTVVPQLLAELDGVEALGNVVVIGATNREDMIDPAIVRPGRLDVKIRIARPDREAAADILGKYLSADLPIDAALVRETGGPEAAVETLIASTVAALYAESTATEFYEVTYASGAHDVVHASAFVSGAMLANIVDRAKKSSIKDHLDGRPGGISTAHLLSAVTTEIDENVDMATGAWEGWSGIGARTGDPVRHVRRRR